MLGIGMQEILIILVVALIVIGPKRLPELARTLGKGFAEFRKAADDLQETVRMDLQKEKHEEFRQKYPHMVPDEDESASTSTAAEAMVDREAAADKDTSTVTGRAAAEEMVDKKTTEPGSEQEDKPDPEPSYNPEEIEGGDETEDDTRDG